MRAAAHSIVRIAVLHATDDIRCSVPQSRRRRRGLKPPFHGRPTSRRLAGETGPVGVTGGTSEAAGAASMSTPRLAPSPGPAKRTLAAGNTEPGTGPARLGAKGVRDRGFV